MLASVNCKVVESMAKIARFNRKMNPACLPYSVKPGQMSCRCASIRQYRASARAGSRVRLAFENVFRAGGVAPRTRMNSASCTANASQMSFRLNACAACP